MLRYVDLIIEFMGAGRMIFRGVHTIILEGCTKFNTFPRGFTCGILSVHKYFPAARVLVPNVMFCATKFK